MRTINVAPLFVTNQSVAKFVCEMPIAVVVILFVERSFEVLILLVVKLPLAFVFLVILIFYRWAHPAPRVLCVKVVLADKLMLMDRTFAPSFVEAEMIAEQPSGARLEFTITIPKLALV